MTLRERWRRWRRRRKESAVEDEGALREFVYLDEVSVYSLMASRRGAIVAELTESQSTSLRAELESSVGASAAVVKAGSRSRMEATQTGGSQVVRKSIIQATFKDLFELEQDRMVLRARDDEPDVEGEQARADADRVLRDAVEHGWATPTADLRRGQLFELDVELEAEPIYRVSTTMSSLLEMIAENPSLSAGVDQAGLVEGMTVTRVLEMLLGSLVPLRGRAVDYRHVTVDDRSWLVHRRIAEAAAGWPAEVRPFYVVGVAEEPLFWKDIRRVLFSRARYSMLCRLGRGGVTDRWTPVKLVEVLREVLPDLATQIDDYARLKLPAHIGELGAVAAQRQSHLIADALIDFGHRLAAHYGKTIDPAELSSVAADAAARLPEETARPVEQIRVAAQAVVEHLRERYGLPSEPVEIARFRYDSMAAAGLLPEPSAGTTALVERGKVDGGDVSDERYLDCEIVAIYW